jgi:ABC-2 type transport system ATP-binding protein
LLVATSNLTKSYGPLRALDDCSLSVEPGEIFGLLGPNGAGKTTLLRLLMGFLRPTSGSATIGGLDCWRDSVRVHRCVAYLPGEVRMPRQLRGREVLEMVAGLRRDGSLPRARELAQRLALDLSRPVAEMSTGMRQKTSLAATLAADAPLLVLDEPTSNLDPNVRSLVVSLVREAQAAGRTVIFSSHVLSEVDQVCDRVAILRAGRLVHVQAMADLRPRHRILARLNGPLLPPPAHLAGELTIRKGNDGDTTIDTPGELAPLLAWLSQLPLAEVRIEPLGLQAVYDQFQPTNGTLA